MDEEKTGIVLVAVDGSSAAQRAAETAVHVARQFRLLVRGLYVVDEALVMDAYADFRRELDHAGEPASRQELLSWFEEQGVEALGKLGLRAATKGVPVTTELVFGGVTDVIRARARHAQVVALGCHGNGHAGEPGHLGSHFRAVSRHVSRPMIVVGGTSGPLRRLLVAYNGGDAARNALAWAVRWQQALPCAADVLVVSEGMSAKWVATMQEEIKQSGLPAYRLLAADGDAGKSIVAVAAERQSDCIVMGGYEHNSLVEWLSGSTLEYVLRHTPLPVLVGCSGRRCRPGPE